MGFSLEEPSYPVVHPNPRPGKVLKNLNFTDLGWIAGFTLLSAPYMYMKGKPIRVASMWYGGGIGFCAGVCFAYQNS
eukprot:CAMPEP_0201511440 /NCGR_PEP_ID=MMETSP0161_2-20130828/3899_1 /ASSEMBLY_ACC=CAM_ASM_000251 /TAXON_ID=180227 /ORGANISM="Neoparamoeba aestuarina, Strain SoJaBio B1-5/56/2" /LENGTH=76 /DNA_ID=CAMNT_0047906937 /DNA_START=71 /DNA_END=298 /DNA_ORIENTATION=+